MRAPSGSKRLITAALTAASAAGGAPPVDRFNQVFTVAGEPAQLRYQVLFRSADGGVHRLDVWRDGDRRLKRVTDRAIISVATHRPGDPGYQLTMFDVRRRIATTIDRDNLYRVGQFTDWFDLGHGLRHPQGRYTLAEASRPATPLPAPVAPCRWYDLAQRSGVSHICWDAAHRVPLLVVAQDRLVWRTIALDARPFGSAAFVVDARGYVANNANQEISGD